MDRSTENAARAESLFNSYPRQKVHDFHIRASQKGSVEEGSSRRRRRRARSARPEQQSSSYPTQYATLLRNIPFPHDLLLALSQPTSLSKVQVMLRLCPCDVEEKQCVRVDPSRRQVLVTDTSTSGTMPAHRKVSTAPRMFAFDSIFPQNSTLREMSSVILPDVVQSVIAGSDGCVLSYGNSKTGKSYSMLGEDTNGELLGLIPNAIWCLFRSIQEQRERTGARFSVRVSALEVSGRQEILTDLLANSAQAQAETRGGTPPGIYLQDGAASFGDVTGLENQSELRAPSADAAAGYLDAALAHRCTNSRPSHVVFTLHVYQYKLECNGASVAGGRSRLHLIDLGSGAKTSTSIRDTQEGTALSLQALGSVLMALANGQRHIPYRESRLSGVLRQALGSLSCRICLIIHVSGRASRHADTLQLLQLAAKIHRAAGRRRGRHSKAGSHSSGDSSSCGSGPRLARLRRETSDASSSEVSADTVIFCGGSSEGEGPPRLRRALRQAEGCSSASDEHMELIKEEFSKSRGCSITSRIPRTFAGARPIVKRTRPEIPSGFSSPSCLSPSPVGQHERWIDGPAQKEQWVDGPNKPHRQEHWVDGPREFQQHSCRHQDNEGQMHEHKIEEKQYSKQKDNLVSQWLMNQDKEEKELADDGYDNNFANTTEDYLYMRQENHNTDLCIPARKATKQLAELPCSVPISNNDDVGELVEPSVQSRSVAAEVRRPSVLEDIAEATEVTSSAQASEGESRSARAEPRHSVAPSFSDTNSSKSVGKDSDIRNSVYEQEVEDLLQRDDIYRLTYVDTDCNLSTLSLTESIKSGSTKLQDLPLPNLDDERPPDQEYLNDELTFDLDDLVSTNRNLVLSCSKTSDTDRGSARDQPIQVSEVQDCKSSEMASNLQIVPNTTQSAAVGKSADESNCSECYFHHVSTSRVRKIEMITDTASQIPKSNWKLTEKSKSQKNPERKHKQEQRRAPCTKAQVEGQVRYAAQSPVHAYQCPQSYASEPSNQFYTHCDCESAPTANLTYQSSPERRPASVGCSPVTQAKFTSTSKLDVIHQMWTENKKKRSARSDSRSKRTKNLSEKQSKRDKKNKLLEGDLRPQHSGLMSPYSKVTSPRPARGASSGHSSCSSASGSQQAKRLAISAGISSGYESMFPAESEGSVCSPGADTGRRRFGRRSRSTPSRSNYPVLALVREMSPHSGPTYTSVHSRGPSLSHSAVSTPATRCQSSSKGTRCRKVDVLLDRQRQLSTQLEEAKRQLMIPSSNWSYDLHVANMTHRSDADYVEALENETSILEKRVHACKAHIMMITCFDSRPQT